MKKVSAHERTRTKWVVVDRVLCCETYKVLIFSVLFYFLDPMIQNNKRDDSSLRQAVSLVSIRSKGNQPLCLTILIL